MDWLWALYREYIEREAPRAGVTNESALKHFFLSTLCESTATLFVMEPVGDTIRFKGLGRWPLPDVPELMSDPNGFIDKRFGGGKFKVNFHHKETFVCTHNFRTYGEERWREMVEVPLS